MEGMVQVTPPKTILAPTILFWGTGWLTVDMYIRSAIMVMVEKIFSSLETFSQILWLPTKNEHIVNKYIHGNKDFIMMVLLENI